MTKPKLSGKAVKKDAAAPAASAPAAKAVKPAPAPRAPRPATAPSASRGSTRASSANFVSVACKVPNGLMLQNYKMVESNEPSPSGARPVKLAVKDGMPIRVHGTARHHGQAPRCPIVMGFAITKRVPAEHWERWLAANKDSAIVKNGLIFANPDTEELRAEAVDNRKQFSGMEPLAMKGDPRSLALFNRKKKLKIETAPESATPHELDHDPENVDPDEN